MTNISKLHLPERKFSKNGASNIPMENEGDDPAA